MSQVDPLIQRELQWMALGVLENKDLATIVIRKVRRRRIRRILFSVGIAFALFSAAGVIYAFLSNNSQKVQTIEKSSVKTGAVGAIDNKTITPQQVTGLTSDYPITWEQSVGDLSAISKAAGVGDTLGGLTAVGLKVSWQRCPVGVCPTSWTLSVKNNTGDIVQLAPALMIFIDHSPLVSSARPVTVTAGQSAFLVYTFPEFTRELSESVNSTWQWNWYLTVPR
jgi:hypothetical protein